MKKTALLLASLLTVAAAPAFAQSVTGNVTINGNVEAKCFVLTNGGVSNSFSTIVNLGELAGPNGRLDPTVGSRFTPVNATAGLSFTVVCSGGTPQATLTATPLVNTAPAGQGFTNLVRYSAGVTFVPAPGSTGRTGFTLPAQAGPSADGPLPIVTLANNGQPNITFNATAFSTVDPNALLVAGAYQGQMVLTIQPAA